MAEPSIVETSTSAVSDVTSVALDVPTHASADVLLLFVSIEDFSSSSPTITATGWTSINSSSAAGYRDQLYYRVIVTPLVTLSVSFSTTVNALVHCAVARNINNASPVQASSTATDSGLIHTASSVTTAEANSMVVCAFMGPNPGTVYNSLSGFNELIKTGRRTVALDPGGEMTVGYRIQAGAGASGTVTTTLTSLISGSSPVGGNSRSFQVALNPSEAPTNPVVLTPTSLENITVGRTAYPITWTPSTDPNIAASLLTYEIDYTNSDGIVWTSLVSPTSAGVSSYNWNTTGLATGTYKIRIRAHNGTEYSGYGISSYFLLIADATPSKPTGLIPSSGYIDRTLNNIFSWTFNDPGDVQKSYYIEYSVNADMSSSSNTGEQTTATSAHTFAGATFSAGFLYWRVKTKGSVDSTYSPFSDIATVLVATPPNAPNITAPTAGSPPTTGNPTITWTNTSVQAKYRIQVKEGGSYVYQGAWIASSQTSVVSAYTFKNGVSTVLYVAIQDSNGLSSTEDSETFTPSYTPPATPTIAVDAFDGIGAVQIAIQNSDTPAYQYVYRYVTSEGSTTAIRISPKLAADATFLDYQARSGVQYTYFVRAFLSTGGFANSATATATLNLTALHIHTLTRTSLTSNANLTVALIALQPMTKTYELPQTQMQFTGRDAEVTAFSQTDYLRLSYKVYIPAADTTTANKWNQVFEARERVCLRDSKGNKIFGKISKRPLTDNHEGITFQLDAVEEDFTEALL